MNTFPALPRTFARRVTCLEKKELVCTRHNWHREPIEILTFTLDGILACHIERDGDTYNAKFGIETHVVLTAGQLLTLLEAL